MEKEEEEEEMSIFEIIHSSYEIEGRERKRKRYLRQCKWLDYASISKFGQEIMKPFELLIFTLIISHYPENFMDTVDTFGVDWRMNGKEYKFYILLYLLCSICLNIYGIHLDL